MQQRGISLAIVVVGAALSGCVTSPNSITADNEAWCQYSAGATGMPMQRCRAKVEARSERVKTANASRIEGYALLNTPPTVQPATAIAGECKPTAAAPCPGDTTASIGGSADRR